MIVAERLGVRFGALQAVRDVSFRVAAGESYGLVGESGSGKSSVLRALVGLVPHWSGRMSVAGEALGRHFSRAYYRQVQMVFQDPYGSLHPRQTIDRQLNEPLVIHRLPGRERLKLQALQEVGLDAGFLFRFPHQLSGGQRQRVAIARAIITRPRVLLLDEPTSALDVSVQAEVLNLLSDLRIRLGLTIILVSHDIAVVGHMCDRIGVMRDGMLLRDVGPDDLISIGEASVRLAPRRPS
jgi:peptide/nickel transport system ATP-binding protein